MDQVATLRAAGYTWPEVSEYFNVRPRTIFGVFNHYKKTGELRGSKKIPIPLLAEAATLREQGLTYQQIGNIYGINASTAQKRCLNYYARTQQKEAVR